MQYTVGLFKRMKMYKICIEEPFQNCELIFPTQQKKIQILLDNLDYDIVKKSDYFWLQRQ